VNRTAVYNTDPSIWEEAARGYRARPDGGPTIRALEGNVWGILKLGWVARFESTEEAERVLVAAGFRYVPEEKGFRAQSEGDRQRTCFRHPTKPGRKLPPGPYRGGRCAE
jgi:hypothetical protein